MNPSEEKNLLHPLTKGYSKFIPILLMVIILSGVAGVGTGYFLAQSQTSLPLVPTSKEAPPQPSLPPQLSQTLEGDSAEGVLERKPEENTSYSEGTHLLRRDNAPPVALTSSVLDLSQYEGKRVRVYGQTQKALTQGWLMDVGKLEVLE